MIIPKHIRRKLKSIGHWHLLWYPAPDWFGGRRFKFRDKTIAYLVGDEIVSIRKGANYLWRKYDHV